MQRNASPGRRRPYSLKPRPRFSGKVSAPRRFGRFLGRHKKLVASGVVALVVAAGVQFREAIFPELFPREKLGDEVRALQGQQPLQIVRVTRVGDPNGGHKFVRPDGYTFQGANADAVRDLSQERGRSVLDQVEKTGGVPVGESLWQILLHGSVDYQVGDRRPHATLDDNGEPFRVTGIRCPGGTPGYRAYYSVSSSAVEETGHFGVSPVDAAAMTYACGD